MARAAAAQNDLAEVLAELGDVAQGVGSVMGPGLRNRLDKEALTYATNPDFIAAVKGDDANAVKDFVRTHMIAAAKFAGKSQADDLKDKVEEVEKSMGTAKHTGLLGSKRDEAELVWKYQRSKVREAILALRKNKKTNKELTSKINDAMGAVMGSAEFSLGSDSAANTANTQKLKQLEALLKVNESQRKQIENDLFTEFQVRLGGLSGGSKQTAIALNLPKK